MAGASATQDGVPQFELRHRMTLAMEHAGIGRDEMAAELDVSKNTVTTIRYIKWHTSGHEVLDGMYDEAA